MYAVGKEDCITEINSRTCLPGMSAFSLKNIFFMWENVPLSVSVWATQILDDALINWIC